MYIFTCNFLQRNDARKTKLKQLQKGVKTTNTETISIFINAITT